MSGTLFLIPNSLGEPSNDALFPPFNLKLVKQLDYFIAENEKNLRRFFKEVGLNSPYNQKVYLLNKHTRPEDLSTFIEPLLRGHDVGLISDAGCPGIADPGSMIVELCHGKGITVKPLIGPSSILLALIASGLNGQGFTFHGYLPVRPPEKERRLKEIEKSSAKTGYTQLFMETPYRNPAMWDQLLKCLHPGTRLSIAAGITQSNEIILTKEVADWNNTPKPDLKDIPAVFSLLA